MKQLGNKKRFIFFLFCSILLFSGCGRENNALMHTQEGDAIRDVDTMDTEKEEKSEENEENKTIETNGNLWQGTEVSVNMQAQVVPYMMEDGIDPLRAVHRCTSNEENIFLAYNETDFYIIPIGADKHSPACIDNPEGMKVCNITVDGYGKIHLLMAGDNYDEWNIWCLNEEYQIQKKIDISSLCDTKYIPIWFLVDKEGIYYLQWPHDRSSILINSDGIMEHKLTPELLGASWIYEAAVGRDGKIYLVYSNEEEKLIVGELDVNNGSIIEGVGEYSFPKDETFSAMSAGTDTNLLLFSPYSGVWAYDEDKEIFENRVVLSELGFGDNVEYWPFTFLADGRLWLMGREWKDETTAEETLIMNYIPAGR